MKNSKSRNEINRQRYDDYEEYDQSKKKSQPKRRPVRNWKKAWIENEDQVDELDEFYGK
jgi:hypothetical protein